MESDDERFIKKLDKKFIGEKIKKEEEPLTIEGLEEIIFRIEKSF